MNAHIYTMQNFPYCMRSYTVHLVCTLHEQCCSLALQGSAKKRKKKRNRHNFATETISIRLFSTNCLKFKTVSLLQPHVIPKCKEKLNKNLLSRSLSAFGLPLSNKWQVTESTKTTITIALLPKCL